MSTGLGVGFSIALGTALALALSIELGVALRVALGGIALSKSLALAHMESGLESE